MAKKRKTFDEINQEFGISSTNKNYSKNNLISMNQDIAPIKKSIGEKVVDIAKNTINSKNAKELGDSFTNIFTNKSNEKLTDRLAKFGGNYEKFQWGTSLNALESVTQGLTTSAEGVTDWILNRGADAVGLVNEKAADKIRDFSDKQSYINQRVEATKNELAPYSLLGDTSNNILNGVGTTMFSAATGGALGEVASFASLGMSAAGNSENEARQEGASVGDARAYGVLSGAIEILTEKMFGGIGGLTAPGFEKGIDDQISEALTKNIKNIWAKNAIQGLVNWTGEGIEEVTSSFLGAFAEKVTYMKDKDLKELITEPNYLEDFIVGLLSAAVGGGSSVVKASASNVSLNSGMTTTDEKVANAIAEERVQNSNEKLTKKQANEVRNKAIEDFQKGYVTNEEIQNATKGMELTNQDIATRNLVNSQSAFQLNEEDTKADFSKKFKNNTKSDEEIQKNLDNFVKTFTSERNSLNNSQSARDKFNFFKTYIETTGNKVDITNYDRLVEEGQVREKSKLVGDNKVKVYEMYDNSTGKWNEITINGFQKDGTIYINRDSAESMDFTFGHELAETIKASNKEMYNEFKELAKKLGELDGTYSEKNIENIAKLYGSNTDSAFDEWCNDKLGELFKGNKELINQLVEADSKSGKTKDGLIDTILNKIKELKTQFFGTEEQKKLLQAEKELKEAKKKLFEKTKDIIQNENITPTKKDTNNVSFSISQKIDNLVTTNSDVYDMVRSSTLKDNGLTMDDLKAQGLDDISKLEEYWKNKNYENSAKNIHETTIEEAVNTIRNDKNFNRLADGWFRDADSQFKPNLEKAIIMNPELRNAGMNIAYNNYQELGQFLGMEQGLSFDEFINKEWTLYRGANESGLVDDDVFVAFTPSKQAAEKFNRNSDIGLEEIKAKIKDTLGSFQTTGEMEVLVPRSIVDDNNIQYSLTKDNQGRELSQGQQEYFKDSKVRDENGNLITMYHGTPNGEFNVFRPGSYFSAKQYYADGYQNPIASSISYGKEVTNPKTYEVYLNITNPFTLTNKVAKDIYIKEYIKGGNSAYFDPYTDYTQTINDMTEIDWVEGEDLKEWLKENHPEFDGLYLDEGGNGGYGGVDYEWRGLSVIPFNSNQIKNVDNLNPTENDDIRYSISKDGIKNISDTFGGGFSYWDANLQGRDLEDTIYYLKHEQSVKNKFIQEKGIVIEPVYKDVEYGALGSNNEKVQQFIKDNDLSVQKLAKNEQLLNEYFDVVKEVIKEKYNIGDEKASNMLEKWRNHFEAQKGAGDSTIWSLLRYDRDFENIKNGNTKELDNMATAQEERKLVDNNPDFDKFVKKYAEPLFGEKVEYDTEDVMDEAKYQHGTTDNFEVGAYMTTDGSLLDFNNGGFRDDHRTISVFDLNMKEFMDYGAIRMQPETPGFEMQVEPTSEQYSKLYDYIDYIKSTRDANDTIRIDIDKGKNYDGATFNMNTPTSTIINDVKTYWKTGSFPQKSNYADFYYSLSKTNDIAPVKPGEITTKDLLIQGTEYAPSVVNANEDLINQGKANYNKAIENMEDKYYYDYFFPMKYTELNSDADNIKYESNLTNEELKELQSLEKRPKWDLNEYERDTLAELQAKEMGTTIDEEVTKLENNVLKEYETIPEVKELVKREAESLLGDIQNRIKGERIFIKEKNPVSQAYENKVYGINRQATSTAADLLDMYSEDALVGGINRILNDKPLSKTSRNIIRAIGNQLVNGYTDMYGNKIAPSTEYRQLVTQLLAEQSSQFTDMEEPPVSPYELDAYEEQKQKVTSVEDLIAPVAKQKRDAAQDFIEKAARKAEGKFISKASPDKNVNNYNKVLDTILQATENRNRYVDNLAKETKNNNIRVLGDMANAAMGEATYDINSSQTNINGEKIGKSISQIFEPSKKAGLYAAFNDYLFNKSNIERHNAGKGSLVPLTESEYLVKEYEKDYPEMKVWANDVYQYNHNILQNQVDAGLIDQTTADFLTNDIYPSYVPFVENIDKSNYHIENGELRANGTLRRSQGGADKNLLAFEEAMQKQTYAYKNAIRNNQLYQEIVNSMDNEVALGIDDRMDTTDLSKSLYADEKGYYLTAYIDGQQKTARISEDLYNELSKKNENFIKDMENKLSPVTNLLQKASNIRRNLITTWNPAFLVRNAIKDIQEASINSKHLKQTMSNFFGTNGESSIVELWKGESKLSQQFKALYGTDTYGDYSSIEGKTKLNTIEKFSKLNEMVELAPRFAEFKASIQSGESLYEAMYNAREVTTNFNRGGYLTKALNRNGFTFLNASVQGLSKLVRNVTEIKGSDNATQAYLGLAAKAAMLGIVPAVLNELAFGAGDDKDEEYEALPDYIKDNYYLIKLPNGDFLRIPKGRILSVIGSAARRSIEYAEGEENAFDGYLSNTWSQVGVGDGSGLQNIFTPLQQAFGSENGEAWYGGDIVPTRLQNVPITEQTDSSISGISNFISQAAYNLSGGNIELSPYKVNYVLDQYSGAIGDILLPMTTESTKNGASNPLEYALAPVKDSFIVNSTDDNKYAGEFYDLKDKLQVKNNGANATEEDALQYKYINTISSEMSQLYKQRREIQSDTSLSKSEKYKQVQEVQDKINALAKEGLENYKNMEVTDNYAEIGGVSYYKKGDTWTKVSNEDDTMLGMNASEKSNYYKTQSNISSIYSSDSSNKKNEITNTITTSGLNDDQKINLYTKYYSSEAKINKVTSTGISFDTYANSVTAIDEIKNTYSTTNERKYAVQEYINNLDLDVGQKLIMQKLVGGYSISSYKDYVYNYIDELNIGSSEKQALFDSLF